MDRFREAEEEDEEDDDDDVAHGEAGEGRATIRKSGGAAFIHPSSLSVLSPLFPSPPPLSGWPPDMPHAKKPTHSFDARTHREVHTTRT